ncbi:hypothetical protein PMKS-003889 [Pichia membranifaciens]|uniref:Actin-binding protein n=1 Tax=Pichia membranifaciens TaxID=4926 RepID=A0A1Q2YLF1_9ASCO|nr:hypothetical protein PMKS-003889 [Pichia membranifaciens]
MEKLDLSTYAKDIKHDYDAVVSGDNTYAIFTTLKDSSLKPTVLGDGDIQEFVSEFEEGAVQFGIIGVNPFGSDVKKLLLLGWCPDSAPIKSKVSYAQNLSTVGKVLHYHVEVTARDSDDLDVDDLLKTVSNASGARYSIQSLTPQKSASSSFKPKPKPAAASSSSFSAFSKPKPAVNPSIIKPKPSLPPKKDTSGSTDDWGDDGEIKERDFSKEPLENLPSAYKPTKVDINALRNGSGSTPEPETKTISINPSGGLTSLPKPKPSHSVLSRFNQEVVKPEFGTKTPSFGSNPSKDSSKLVGGLSRNFGAENGKTPAQLWAEKKGQYKEVPNNDKPVNAEDIEKEVDHEDISLNSAKAKFEKLHLEAQKEEEFEKPVKSSISSFPPPPARNEPVKQFPPPPAREEEEEEEAEEEEEKFKSNPLSSFPPPPKKDVFSKFEEKPAEDKEDDGWGDDDEESVMEQHKSFPPSASSNTPAALPPRPVPAAPVQEEEPTVPSSSSTGGKQAVAEYDYEKDEDNEIGFTEGEKIIDIEFVDEDWWQGTNSSGETGLFPASYVNLIEVSSSAPASSGPAPPSLPSRDLPVEEAKSVGLSAVAEYDYDATEENELTFKEGDIINDIDKVDDDWWLGSLNGEKKLFPANYVTLQ